MLFNSLVQFSDQLGFFNVFRYITFRTGGAMITALKAGQCVGVTPDGPRGPRMRVSAGVVHAARLAGVPGEPVTSAAPIALPDPSPGQAR